MDVFDYTEDELKADPEKRKQVFNEMLNRLEDEGNCRYVFHALAYVLFGDRLDGGPDEPIDD